MRRVPAGARRPGRAAFFFAALLLALGLAAPLASAASPQDVLSFAQSLAKDGENYRAITEYMRFLHDFPDHPDRDRALLGMGRAYLSGQEPSRSLDALKRLVDEFPESPLVPEAWLLICRARTAMDPAQGMACLSSLAQSPDPGLAARAARSLGFALLDAGNWEGARDAFLAVGPSAVGLAAALDPLPNLPYKSPTVAGALAVMPGAGHLYLGRYQDAFIAFLLNAGLGIAAWEAFDNDMPALGGVVSVAAFGFYAGNFYGAVTGARKHNERIRHGFVHDLEKQYGPRAGAKTGAKTPGVVLAWTVRF
ncbi:MAG: tetratricopeptide repeat protein [Pseudomonadota bacterium]